MRKLNLDNMKIGNRLKYGFLSIIALYLVTVVINLSGLQIIKNQLTDFYNSPYMVTTAAADLRGALNGLEKTTMEYVYNLTDTKELDIEKKEYEEILNESISIVEEKFLGDKTKVEALKEVLAKEKQLENEIITLG